MATRFLIFRRLRLLGNRSWGSDQLRKSHGSSQKSNYEVLTTESYDKTFSRSLLSLGFDKVRVEGAIIRSPEILQATIAETTSVLNILLQYGFSHSNIIEMITKYPDLLHVDKERIHDVTEVIRRCGLSEVFCCKFLTSNPSVFSIDPKALHKRLARLSYIFEQKINRVTNLLSLSPAVLWMEWKYIEERLNYVLIEMGCTEKELSQSRALLHSLEHLRLRHTFLLRCGLFIRRREHGDTKDMGLNPHVNPRLTDIVDTSNNSFAENVAKVTIEEFNVFRDLIKYDDEYEPEDDSDSELEMSDDED